jgi:hypothetical protein
MAHRRTLLVAVLVVLAGCSAPFGSGPATDADPSVPTDQPTAATPTPGDTPTTTATETPTTTQTETPEETETEPPETETETTTDPDGDGPRPYDVNVVGEGMPADANLTFARVNELLNTSVEEPSTVEIVSEEEATITSGQSQVPGPLQLLGVTYEQNGSPSYAGLTSGPDTIKMNSGIFDDPYDTKTTLAHEYVHAVQFRKQVFGDVQYSYDISGPGPRHANTGTIEGAATYTMDVYAERYLEDPKSATDARLEFLRTGNDSGYKFLIAPYAFGGRYFEERFDSPAELSAAYENPPKTTEALIHGYAPGEEPPVDLSIDAEDGDWYDIGSSERVGELSTRIALDTELNYSTAVAGADGWGNDRLMEFLNDGNVSYAWALRWDDAANATEFGDTFGTYLDERATEDGETWVATDGTAFRLVQTSDRTTVVLFGAEEFVRGASASGGTNVTVTAP